MLKLGRAQGTAIAAALSRDLPIFEYAPLKIKMAITGNGRASKEQVADMLRRQLKIQAEDLLPQLDATDGLAARAVSLPPDQPPPNGKTLQQLERLHRKKPDQNQVKKLETTRFHE